MHTHCASMEYYIQLQNRQVSVFKVVQHTLTDATPLIFPHSLKNTARLASILVTCASSKIIPMVRSPKGWRGARSGTKRCGSVVMPTVLVIGWMNITLAFICEGKMFHFSTTVFLWDSCTLCMNLLVYSLKLHARYQNTLPWTKQPVHGSHFPRLTKFPDFYSVFSSFFQFF